MQGQAYQLKEESMIATLISHQCPSIGLESKAAGVCGQSQLQNDDFGAAICRHFLTKSQSLHVVPQFLATRRALSHLYQGRIASGQMRTT
jgi:hypothetical protein